MYAYLKIEHPKGKWSIIIFDITVVCHKFWQISICFDYPCHIYIYILLAVYIYIYKCICLKKKTRYTYIDILYVYIYIYIILCIHIYFYLSHGSPLHHPDFSIEPGWLPTQRPLTILPLAQIPEPARCRDWRLPSTRGTRGTMGSLTNHGDVTPYGGCKGFNQDDFRKSVSKWMDVAMGENKLGIFGGCSKHLSRESRSSRSAFHGRDLPPFF